MQTKVLIGIPCMDTIKVETMVSLFAASALISHPAKLHVQKNCYVHVARNKICQEAIDQNFSHVMFIDSDMQFPPEGIEKLINLNKDVVGGLYYRRQPPHYPTINELENDKIVVPKKFDREKMFKVWSVATGFMLIKTQVLKKLDPPWFYFGKYKGKTEMGEDVYFCRKVNDKGFEVWCDPTIPLGHVGEYAFGEQDWKAYEDLRPREAVEDEFDGQMK